MLPLLGPLKPESWAIGIEGKRWRVAYRSRLLRPLMWKARDVDVDTHTSQFVGLDSAAFRLNVPRSWLHAEAKAGRVPCLRVGKRLFFSVDAVFRSLAVRTGGGDNDTDTRRKADADPIHTIKVDEDMDKVLPVVPAARLLRVPSQWLRREAEAGRIPCLRADKAILFHIYTVRRILIEATKIAGLSDYSK